MHSLCSADKKYDYERCTHWTDGSRRVLAEGNNAKYMARGSSGDAALWTHATCAVGRWQTLLTRIHYGACGLTGRAKLESEEEETVRRRS